MPRKVSKSQAIPQNWIVLAVIAVFVGGSIVYAGWGSGYLGARSFSVASTPTPGPANAQFNCSPRQQTVYTNQQVTVIEDPSGLQWSTRWAAPGGKSASGGPSLSFQTSYATVGDYTVTATSLDGFPGGARTDTCQVKIIPSPTPTGSPTGSQSWQNQHNRFDVNGDGSVTPNDLLRLNNTYHSKGVRDLVKTNEPLPPPNYIDVNGDKWFTAADIQAVQGCLNKGGKNC